MTHAAKGGAEHVILHSHGALTNPGNLTNACSACNYVRGNKSMDALGAPASRRPLSEVEWVHEVLR